MRGFLLDSNCISELVRPKPEARVMEWMEAVAMKDAIRAVAPDVETSSDSNLRSAFWIAILIRNVFAHSPFAAMWRIDRNCPRNAIFKVADLIELDTVPIPCRQIRQQGNLIMEKVDKIPPDAIPRKIRKRSDGGIDLGGGHILYPQKQDSAEGWQDNSAKAIHEVRKQRSGDGVSLQLTLLAP